MSWNYRQNQSRDVVIQLVETGSEDSGYSERDIGESEIEYESDYQERNTTKRRQVEKYNHGTVVGDLYKADKDIIRKGIKRYNKRCLEDMGYKQSFLGRMIIDFLDCLDDGLVFILLLYLLFSIFIAMIWFLITRVDVIAEEIHRRDFSSALGAIAFLIALIVGDRFRKAISDASDESAKYLAYIAEIRSLAESLSDVFYATYGITPSQLACRYTEGQYIPNESHEHIVVEARNLSRAILQTLLALAYHSFSCFGDNKISLDVHYFIYGICKGEIYIYRNIDWTETNFRSYENIRTDARVLEEHTLLLSNKKKLMSESVSKGFWLIPRHDEFDDEDDEAVNLREIIRRRKIIAKLRDHYSIDELRMIEYRLQLDSGERKPRSRNIFRISENRYQFSEQAIRKLAELITKRVSKASLLTTIETRTNAVREKLTSISIENKTLRPPAYNYTFNMIVSFYLIVLVPLQVISSANAYWGFLIIPTIMMIFIVPVVISNWIGTPFQERKEDKHPPHREYRSGLLQDISLLFGYHDGILRDVCK